MPALSLTTAAGSAPPPLSQARASRSSGKRRVGRSVIVESSNGSGVVVGRSESTRAAVDEKLLPCRVEWQGRIDPAALVRDLVRVAGQQNAAPVADRFVGDPVHVGEQIRRAVVADRAVELGLL